MKEIYKEALSELSDSGLRFCLVHSRDLDRYKKDLDIITDDNDHLIQVLLKLGYIKLTSFHWVKFNYFYGEWVIIDSSEKYNFLRLSLTELKKQVLNNAVFFESENFKCLNNSDLAIYTFLKAICIRGYFPEKYVNIIAKGISFDVFNKENYLHYTFLSDELLTEIKILISNGDIKTLDSMVIFFRRKLSDYISIKQTNSFSFRIWTRLWSNGRMIAFIGPDGSGKSTLVNIFSKLPLVDIQYMGPGQNDKDISPFLRSIRDFLYKKRDKSTKSSILGKIIRILYLFILYLDLLERYFKSSYKSKSDKLVLFDRYALDVYVRNPDFLRRFLFLKLFPSPKNILYLKGSALDIHNRKPELTVERLNSTYDIYDVELYKIGNVYVLNSTKMNVEESVNEILKIFSSKGLLPL